MHLPHYMRNPQFTDTSLSELSGSNLATHGCCNISFLPTCRIMPSHTPYKVERMLQDQGKRRSELQTSPSLNTGVEGDEGACSPDGPPQLASIEPLPVQVIERNRLSLEEIRKLPRFGDYAPGLPSKVNPCAV